MATFEIFPHFDAARGGESDERPLTEIGARQAAMMAADLLAAGPVHGVFASPNRRCRDSVVPLAAGSVDVQQIHGFEFPPPVTMRGTPQRPHTRPAAPTPSRGGSASKPDAVRPLHGRRRHHHVAGRVRRRHERVARRRSSRWRRPANLRRGSVCTVVLTVTGHV